MCICDGFFATFALVKRLMFILLFLLLVLASCHDAQYEARQMVRCAERLFDTDPDSTVALIDSVLRMPVYFNEKHRMEMALLQGEALFGDHGQEIPPLMDDEFFDDKPFLTISPELERATDYYARKKQYAKAAHAALYSGYVQQHYGEKQIAMESFKDAERYSRLAVDSLTMARAQCLMGKMLYDDNTNDEALSMFKSANCGFGDHFVEKALVQNMIAVCYLLRGDFDNADFCLQQSMLHIEQSSLDKVRRKVLNSFAVLYRVQGKYNLAIAFLRQIGNEPNLTETEKTLLCLNLGKTYLAYGEIDSATVYFRQLGDNLPIVKVKDESKVSAYGALSQFAKSIGYDSLALQYREIHEKLLYEMMRQRQEQNIYRIQQQYDYENLQNVLNRKIILRHRIILIISLLLLVAAVIIFVLQLRHKRMQEAEAEMKRQIDNLKSDLKQSVKTSYLEQELSSHLRLIISAYRKRKKGYDPNNEWSSIVYKLMNGKESAFDAVLAELEKVYPNIYAILRQKYPELNETETKVCLLSCSDLSNTEMAEIMEMSKYTIDKNRSKLRDKLNLKPEKMKEQLHQVLSS